MKLGGFSEYTEVTTKKISKNFIDNILKAVINIFNILGLLKCKMNLSKMPRLYSTLFCFILAALAFSGDAIAQKYESRPNRIIFIISDDHRYDYMGFMGKVDWLETPNMDRLAAEGAHCSEAYVTTSLCSPSRATILTGLYTHQHTIVDNFAANPGIHTYFPKYLQDAGYKTAFFGKWHMGDESNSPQPGFDHWESFKGQGVYYGPLLNINGVEIQYDKDVYTTDLLTEHAIEWMNEQDPNQPCFVYLSHKSVHQEFFPAKRHEGMYDGNKITLPPTYEQTKTGTYRELKWPEWVKEQRISWHGVDYMYHSAVSIHDLVTDYCETLMGVDDSIGAILDYLEASGASDNSLVIYMSDNGFSWGEHGLIDKRHFYEESARVPLIMRLPNKINKNQINSSLISNADIAPTILDFAQAKIPDYFAGQSAKDTFNRNEQKRDVLFYEYYWEYDFPMTPTTFGVRDSQYKLIRYHGVWDRNELYDLKNDPHEMYNLIENPDHQDRIISMTGALYDWLSDTNGMLIPLKRTIKHRWGDYKHMGQY